MKKNEYTTETPVFSDKLDILETTDPGHADILNPINKQIFGNTLYLREKMNEYIGSTDDSDNGIGFVEGIKADNVVDAINEVFQLGNENKNKLVDNLVAMGVPASTEETWEELLNKVLDMTDTSKDTVTAEVLLEGYTAHDATGELVTGIIHERAGTTVETTGVTQDDSYTYFGVPEGHYDENSKVRAINSDLKTKVKLASNKTQASYTIDVKSLYPLNYNSFTSDNFIVEIITIPSKRSSDVGSGWSNASVWTSLSSFAVQKSYNASTGILTVSGLSVTASLGGQDTPGTSATSTAVTNVWLVN